MTQKSPTSRGQYARNIAIGVALGAALGVAMGNIALGMVIGIVIGGLSSLWMETRTRADSSAPADEPQSLEDHPEQD